MFTDFTGVFGHLLRQKFGIGIDEITHAEATFGTDDNGSGKLKYRCHDLCGCRMATRSKF